MSTIFNQYKVGVDYYSIDTASFRYISHHGILGQKWGVRRYQNKDGTLTSMGKKRSSKYHERKINRADNKRVNLKIKRNNSIKRSGAHSLKSLDYMKRVARGEAEVKTLVANATRDGYNVTHLPLYVKFGKAFIFSNPHHRYVVD